MAQVTLKDLLEAGVHFGHQTRRWNPKMAPYIYGEKNKVHIIDLQKTLAYLKDATNFVSKIAASGKDILFVGTKKQAQISLVEAAKRCNCPYVNHRWLGGMLTNFMTVRQSVGKLNSIKKMEAENNWEGLTKKERGSLTIERQKMEKNLGGVQAMLELPGALFVVDTKKEHIAIQEANRLHIPIIALVDSNSNPDGIDYVIPGNDDAIRAVTLMCNVIADAVVEGRASAPVKVDKKAAEEVAPAAAAAVETPVVPQA